jgi:transmembrane sensor
VNKDIDNKLFNQATEWLATLHAEESPNWDDAGLSEWLEQSEDHRLAFAEASGYWFAVEELSLQEMASPARLPSVFRRRPAWPVWTGSALAMVFVAWLAAPILAGGWQSVLHDYHAPDGQVISQSLADGSSMLLAGNTSADIEFSEDSRIIRLSHGEAFFDVQHDPDRPFKVEFPGGDVVVLGTRFGIAAHPVESLVGVVEGRVDTGSKNSDQRRVLSRQQLVRFFDAKIVADDRRPEDLFAWTHGQLMFQEQTLSAILSRLDLYMPGRLLLLGDSRPERLFSLVVSLDNADQALETLADEAGFKRLKLPGTTVLY